MSENRPRLVQYTTFNGHTYSLRGGDGRSDLFKTAHGPDM